MAASGFAFASEDGGLSRVQRRWTTEVASLPGALTALYRDDGSECFVGINARGERCWEESFARFARRMLAPFRDHAAVSVWPDCSWFEDGLSQPLPPW